MPPVAITSEVLPLVELPSGVLSPVVLSPVVTPVVVVLPVVVVDVLLLPSLELLLSVFGLSVELFLSISLVLVSDSSFLSPNPCHRQFQS